MKNKSDGLIFKFMAVAVTAALIAGASIGCNDKSAKEILNSLIAEQSCQKNTDNNTENSDSETTSDNSITNTNETDSEVSGENTSSENDTSTEPFTTTDSIITTNPITTSPTTTKPVTTKPTTTKPTTTKPTTTKPTTTKKPQSGDEETTTKTPTPEKVNINTASAPGTLAESSNGIIIDYSYAATKGYIMVKDAENTGKQVLVQITGPDGSEYRYYINTEGKYEALILGSGGGTYNIKVYMQNDNGKYSSKCSASITGKTVNDTFTYSTNKVEFNKSSAAVTESYEICAGLTSDEAKVKAIYNYIVKNITYDYDKAKSGVSTRYPNADATLKAGKGVCSDYACLFAVMCRAQRIPVKMIWGYIYPGSDGEQTYHAWNQVYYGGSWHFFDTTKNKTSMGSITYTPKELY